MAKTIFDAIDEDSNGSLDKNEVLQATEMMVEQGLLHLDGSTALSLTESLMKEFDTDNNGCLDIGECVLCCLDMNFWI